MTGNPTPSGSSGANPSAGGAAGSTPAAPNSGQVHFNSVIYLDEDGSNYNSWKLRIQWILRNRRIWGIVNGTTTMPDANDDPVAHATWVEKDEEAFCHVLMSLKDESTHYIEKATSSKEAWDALSARYNSCSEERVVELI